MSYRKSNQLKIVTIKEMIDLRKKKTYKGWYGIESTGREEIKK
jgi:hypothetical protein